MYQPVITAAPEVILLYSDTKHAQSFYYPVKKWGRHSCSQVQPETGGGILIRSFFCLASAKCSLHVSLLSDRPEHWQHWSWWWWVPVLSLLDYILITQQSLYPLAVRSDHDKFAKVMKTRLKKACSNNASVHLSWCIYTFQCFWNKTAYPGLNTKKKMDLQRASLLGSRFKRKCICCCERKNFFSE